MSKTTVITREDVTRIESEMEERSGILTEGQIAALVQRVNQVINIPFMREAREGAVFYRIIKWADHELYKVLPNEIYELIRTKDDGMEQNEADRIQTRVIPILNVVINIPFVPEFLEERIIGAIVGPILNALLKDRRLEDNPSLIAE